VPEPCDTRHEVLAFSNTQINDFLRTFARLESRLMILSE
jgi:hypothetical protein